MSHVFPSPKNETFGSDEPEVNRVLTTLQQILQKYSKLSSPLEVSR